MTSATGSCTSIYSAPVPLLPPATGRPRSAEELACIGYNLTLPEWERAWRTIDCPLVFRRLMFPPGPTTPVGIPQTFQGTQGTFQGTFRVSQDVSETTSQSIPQTTSQSIPQTISQSIPQTISQSIPQTISQSIPQTISQSIPQNALGNTSQAPIAFSPTGFRQLTDDFEYMFSQYFTPLPGPGGKGGHTISVPGQAGFNAFQEVLIDACSLSQFGLQGACQYVANRMCASCSREAVPNSRDTLRLCGCAVPPLNPDVYGGIPRECDPLCAQGSISKLRDPASGAVADCNATVCVINNVSITAAKSTVGGISFTQVCPQCRAVATITDPSGYTFIAAPPLGAEPNGVCKCIIDVSIPSIAQAVGVSDKTTFRQACGTNSICLTVNNQTQQVTEVPCESAIRPVQPRTFFFPTPIWVWIVGAVLVVIGILVVVAAWYAGRPPTVSNRIVSTRTT